MSNSNINNSFADVNPNNWNSFGRKEKYDEKNTQLKKSGSVQNYKQTYNKETPNEYRARHERNASKSVAFTNNNKKYNKTPGIADFRRLDSSLERKPDVYKKKYQPAPTLGDVSHQFKHTERKKKKKNSL